MPEMAAEPVEHAGTIPATPGELQADRVPVRDPFAQARLQQDGSRLGGGLGQKPPMKALGPFFQPAIAAQRLHRNLLQFAVNELLGVEQAHASGKDNLGEHGKARQE